MAKRPTIDHTDQGAQLVIPGAERVTDRELAERRMAGPLRASVAQQRPGGLFDCDQPQQPPLDLAEKGGRRP